MRAIDPNGMEIVIIGDKKYTQQILNFLGNLGSSSNKGAQLVLDAINSDKKFVIFDPSNEKAHARVDSFSSDNGYETLGFDVNQTNGEYGPDNGRNGNSLKHTGETSLAHELSHFNNENDNDANVIERPDGYAGPLSSEVNAVKEENQVRREMGLPERTHYKGMNIYGKKAQRIDKTKSRLVRDKDYSVNVPGIGKKTFQLIFKYYTGRHVQPVGAYHRGSSKLISGKHVKNSNKISKQLLINNNRGY